MANTADQISATTTQKAYTVEQLATAWQVSKSHLYEQMATGRLPYFSIGRSRRVLVEDAEEYIKAHMGAR